MRKKVWAKDYIESRSDVVVFEPEMMKGKWNNGKEKLRVEIGSGKGDYWIGMSKLYPNDMWVAVEKDESCTGIALKKIENVNDNMKFVHADAANISNWFNENEVDIIHLNFSDPWPKKHHSKRRLSADSFVNDYKKILKKDGLIIMKTDNKQLFEFSLVSFSQHGLILQEASVDYRRDVHDEDVITEYERNFMDLGQPIYRCIFKINKE